MSLANKDPQLKKERGYRGKSFVRPDGTESLLDRRDWELRTHELWRRAGGRCEYEMAFFEGRCNQEGVIPAHIRPRHPKRIDNLWNLKLYCLEHDRQTEKQAWRRPRWGEGKTEFKKRSATR